MPVLLSAWRHQDLRLQLFHLLKVSGQILSSQLHIQ